MEKEIARLKNNIGIIEKICLTVDEDASKLTLSPDAWTIKEILGHLVDSAANNYQRFIRLQETDRLDFPGYHYDWVKIVDYNSYPFEGILLLFKQFNLLLCHIIGGIREEDLQHIWIFGERNLSLSFLVTDYNDHMEIHIKQLRDRLDELGTQKID